jgi:nucleotide-binding universal stress UspA family protein
MFNSIVIGTDGSETAGQALEEACALAKRLNARLHVVSAYEPLSDASAEAEETTLTPTFEVDSVLETAAGKGSAAGVEVETYARRGDPAEAILDVADEQAADLIIIGNRGMRGAKRFLLGSVPNKISHHAPCSVMIVRTVA